MNHSSPIFKTSRAGIWRKNFALFYFIIKKIFIGVYLLYKIVFVSNIQQSESAMLIFICLLLWVSFLF